MGRTLRLSIALLSFLTLQFATSAGADTTTTTTTPTTATTTPTTTTTTPSGIAILNQSFALASREKSMTISGTLSGPGVTLRIVGDYTAKASEGISTVKGVGTSYEVQPNGAKYGYVRANSIAALRAQLGITKPKSSETNVWFKVTSKDPRFAGFFGGANTVAQTFSFSPIGWIRSANYEGTTVVNGVQVYMLVAASHLFVDQSGYNEETLYVTDSAHPLPFAMTGPVGATGLIYFSKWNSTKIAIPKATTALPH
jgi:hypothetical protein